MSLIKCPECKQSISDTCESCPHCGYKIKNEGKAIFKCAEPRFGSMIRWHCFLKNADTGEEIASFSQGESFVLKYTKKLKIQVSMSKGFFGKPIVELIPGEKKEFYISVRGFGSVNVEEIDIK